LNPLEVARLGEQLAGEYLEGEGYLLRHRNWRCPRGEIDIVAEKDGRLVIVEVKTRRSQRFGSGEDSVTPRKLTNLEHSAWAYLEEYALLERSWRVDVIAVDLDPHGQLIRLDHLQDVLQR
jgi:putative endonuclease